MIFLSGVSKSFFSGSKILNFSLIISANLGTSETVETSFRSSMIILRR